MKRRPTAILPPAFAAASILLICCAAPAQDRGGPAYTVVRGFPKLHEGMKLGAASGVATDADDNLYVFHRGDPARPILVFDKAGAFLRSFGDGLFISTHGLRIAPDGNVWCTDSENHTVVKFSPDGKVLMTLGERDVKGEDERHFNRPTDVAFGKSGDVYVSDGYGNSRVVKFDKSGKFLLAWGRKGTGPGEFDAPHQVRLDSKGDVYVADRENKRVQVFTPDGKFIRQFGEGIAPYGLFITPNDEVFVADGLKNEVLKLDKGGKVLLRWGGGGREPGKFFLPHGLHVGRDGAVYVGEITNARVQKFVPAEAEQRQARYGPPADPKPEYGEGLTPGEVRAGWIALPEMPAATVWAGTPYNGRPYTSRMIPIKPATSPLRLGEPDKDWKIIPHPTLPRERQATWEPIERDGRVVGFHAVGGPGCLELPGLYGDVVLQVDVNCRRRLTNAGVFFRSRPGDFLNGYEAQVFNGCVDGDAAKPARYATGAIDDRQNARRLVSRDGEPFTMTIVAKGPHIATWVNGVQVTDWTDDRAPSDNPRRGLRLQPGTIQLQAHGQETDVDFANPRIAALDASR
jgi:DNA-binding beta-propeller fold protein YncE